MASAKLMIPKRSAPYYVLTANVTVHGKRVRRYGRFDFDPTVLKTHRQRENAAIEAALVFERAEQQKGTRKLAIKCMNNGRKERNNISIQR